MIIALDKIQDAALASAKMALGALHYARTGSTPDYAYQSMIRLFALTRGLSNDLISTVVGAFHPPYRLPTSNGVLGNLDASQLANITSQVRHRGFHVFEQRLPREFCDALLEFALTQPCMSRKMDSSKAPESAPKVYNREQPKSIIYDFAAEDLINNATVQELMCDSSIIAVAQSYLRARPVLDTVNLWWTTSYGDGPDHNAAQLYHFDMDHLKWLKFFIYLTDVSSENGPHCFVEGSHRTGGIPDKLLSKGYARHPDADVAASYPPQKLVEFSGPAGTVIAEDTRGLHKGKPVLSGDRLIFEFEFSNCLFGGKGPSAARIRQLRSARFKQALCDYRRIYERWTNASAD